MVNNLERGYLIEKVHSLLDRSQMPERSPDERLDLYLQISSIMLALQKTTRPLTWFKLHWPKLSFAETANYVEVVGSITTRLEAIDLRNTLKAEGLDNFRVRYGTSNWYVEDAPESEESRAMERIAAEYSFAWKVFRTPGNDAVNLVCKNAYNTEQGTALSRQLGDMLKERYPYMLLVIRVPNADPTLPQTRYVP